ncbi:MAG TPA: bifunctional phosphoribosylaminoimidazolecarboxamide formyltransferase/IMP cyclohydrolase, partial [Caulobacteraceae bacterium]|nr:bifunctional phosphoribosylaminoimidazolecarboxamide formyltransferase/IMP cyclohydrolase [Caulobacteraceae bacterium]
MTAPAFPPSPDLVPLRRALISVSDKTGLIDAATALAAAGVELVSTGGTRAAIAAAGIAVKDVADLTGFPEMMDGRVKTLHPVVHGGLLGVRDAPEHAQAMSDHGIGGIDLLYVNLYPFEATVARGAGFAECIENIDIGGPAMIRSGAKNHGYVAVCTGPEDMAEVLEALAAGGTTLALRKRLAARAYARTAAYDAAISTWFAGQLGEEWPKRKAIAGELRQA